MNDSALPKRTDMRHLERLRVRWVEVDMQQIVFNSHYLMYFDTAIAGYWRALALPYHDTMAALGGDLFVRKATLEYLGSARYDDQLEIGIRCARVGSSSMLLHGSVFRGDRCLVHGELVYVFADPATQTAKPIPASLRDTLTQFEAGGSMVEVRCGDWRALGAQAGAIRTEVFVLEQGIAASLEHDAADADAVHAVAFNRLGRALGTARLLAMAEGVGKIGRLAVLASIRGARVGRWLLDALVDAARVRGDVRVILHAQASAVSFYRQAGFTEHGAAFVEAGIQHQEMVLTLR